MPEKPFTVVHDLFPVSSDAVEAAFSVFNPSVDKVRQQRIIELQARQFQETNRDLLNVLLFRRKTILEEDIEGIEMSEDMKRSSEKIYRSYKLGLFIAYDALSIEAVLREDTGILPEIPKDIRLAWLHDDIEGHVHDLYNLIDIIRGQDPENTIESLTVLERMNKYRSGRIQNFMNRELAFKEAVDKYIEGGKDSVDVNLPSFVQGIYHVGSVFEAYHMAEVIKQTFGR